jgi:hypothetical protein
MGLKDLQTNLKSFKFGVPPATDRPQGGNSGEPYIKKSIERGTIPQSEDFLLRGGINAPLDAATDIVRLTKFFADLKSPRGTLFVAKQNILSRTGVATQASDIIDWKNAPLNEGVYTPLSTIAQAGVGFSGGHLPKQGAIPFMGVRTYTDAKFQVIGAPNGEGNRLVDFYNEKIDKTSLSPNLYSYSGGPNSDLGIGKTNIYLVPSEQRTGINNPKLKKSGFFPVPPPPPSIEEILNSNVGILGSENSNFTPETTETGIIPKSGFSVFRQQLKPIIPLEKKEILFFNDNTVTNKYADTVGIFNVPKNLKSGLNVSNDAKSFLIKATSVYPNSIPGKPSFVQKGDNRIYDNNTLTLNQEQLNSQLNNQPNKSNPGSAIQDFRVPLLKGKKTSFVTGIAPSYSAQDDPDTAKNESKSIEGTETSRIRQQSPGAQGNRINYTKGKIVNGKVSVVDRINFQPLYKSTDVRTDNDVDKNDLVKFRIAAVLRTKDKDNNLPEKIYTHFRAFINSFSDAYNASWDSIKYMGRGEEFYKYGGFGRKISLSFTVAAQSKPELMAQYKKLNFLASTLAPDYGDSGYMGGVLTTLTMGGWCYELPGFISSLTLEVPQESPWEIAIPASEKDADTGNPIFSDKTVKEMPHICNVSMDFTPIHTFRPELQQNKYDDGSYNEVSEYGKQQFLELTNAYNNNYVPVSLKDAQTPNSKQST